MLPPFVPPSARSASDHLPPITDFVIDEADRSFDTAVNPEAVVEDARQESPLAEEGALVASERPPVAISAEQREADRSTSPFVVGGIEYSTTLPLIEDFVLREPYVERVEAGAGSVQATAADEPQFVQLHHVVSQPRVEDFAESTAAVNREDPKPITVGPETPAAAQPPKPKDWIEEERDAFDWNSVATLAAPSDDEDRAMREWMSTDWESSPTSKSQSEQIASVLMQLARRVRSGELKIESVRGMSTEAALAAVLTSLLSDPEIELDRANRE